MGEPRRREHRSELAAPVEGDAGEEVLVAEAPEVDEPNDDDDPPITFFPTPDAPGDEGL